MMMRVPKTLLVTMTPPGARNVGEIVLRDLCALLPAGSISVFSAGPYAPDSNQYPHVMYSGFEERAWRPLAGRAGGLLNWLRTNVVFSRQVKKLAAAAVEYGQQQDVEQVWIVLNSLSLIGAAKEIADGLDVPLRTLVWDPPEYLAIRKGWDRFSCGWLLQRFGQALRHSEKVMVVSQAMMDAYQKRYQTPCVIVRHAVNVEGELDLPSLGGERDPLRIGFFGTLYDPSQMNHLLRALHELKWSVRERPVTLRVLCDKLNIRGIDFPCKVEFLGRRDTDEEALHLLRDCHLNYLPVPFLEAWEQFARQSFPTKLSAYLAAGRPVLVHGPEYASSIRFVRENGCGAAVSSQAVSELAAQIQWILGSPEVYQKICEKGQLAYREHFSHPVMKKNFFSFMDLEAPFDGERSE